MSTRFLGLGAFFSQRCSKQKLTLLTQEIIPDPAPAPAPPATFSCACDVCKSSPAPTPHELAALSSQLLATFILSFKVNFAKRIVSKLFSDGAVLPFSSVADDPAWPTLLAARPMDDMLSTTLTSLANPDTLATFYQVALFDVFMELTLLSPLPICIGTLLRDPSLLRRAHALFLQHARFVEVHPIPTPAFHDPSSIVEWSLLALSLGSIKRSGIWADRAKWRPEIDKFSKRWFEGVRKLAKDRARIYAAAEEFLRVSTWVGGVGGWEILMRNGASRLESGDLDRGLFMVLGIFTKD